MKEDDSHPKNTKEHDLREIIILCAAGVSLVIWLTLFCSL